MLARVERPETAADAPLFDTLRDVAECASCIQLQRALETRDVIATAKGLVMEQFGVTNGEAFQVLVKVSQNANIRVNEVAQRLVSRHDGDVLRRRHAAQRDPAIVVDTGKSGV